MNNLHKVVTQLLPRVDLNPRPVDRKSKSVAPPCHLNNSNNNNNIHIPIHKVRQRRATCSSGLSYKICHKCGHETLPVSSGTLLSLPSDEISRPSNHRTGPHNLLTLDLT